MIFISYFLIDINCADWVKNCQDIPDPQSHFPSQVQHFPNDPSHSYIPRIPSYHEAERQKENNVTVSILAFEIYL